MAQYLMQEHLNSDGEPDKKIRAMIKRRPRKKKAKLDVNRGDDIDGSNDSNFTSGSSDGSSSGDGSAADEPLTNAEVSSACFHQLCSTSIFFHQLADVLPAKSIPKIHQSQKRKRRVCGTVVVEEAEDLDSPCQISAQSQSPLDPNVILEEAPELATSEATFSAGSANKKARKVRVIIFSGKY